MSKEVTIERYAVVVSVPMVYGIVIEREQSLEKAIKYFAARRETVQELDRKIQLDRLISIMELAIIHDGYNEKMYESTDHKLTMVLSFPSANEALLFIDTLKALE